DRASRRRKAVVRDFRYGQVNGWAAIGLMWTFAGVVIALGIAQRGRAAKELEFVAVLIARLFAADADVPIASVVHGFQLRLDHLRSCLGPDVIVFPWFEIARLGGCLSRNHISSAVHADADAESQHLPDIVEVR